MAQSRLEVDFSELKSLAAKELAEQYQVSALFNVHSTSTFKLKMNARTMEALGLREDSFSNKINRLEHPLKRIAFAKAAVNKVGQNLLPEGRVLLQSLLLGPLQASVVTLKPTDEQFSEMIRFLEAYNDFWKIMGRETVPEIESPSGETLSDDSLKLLRHFNDTQHNSVKYRKARKYSPMKVSKPNLEHLLMDVFNVPRNELSDIKNAAAVRAYVVERFESYGLLVTEHVFATYEMDHLFGQRVEGKNIVGILGGSLMGTNKDQPVVVGAHIDTVVGSPGADDNGSGMAALLEAARMISSSGCVFENSIIFVAFDLEELGTQGSMMFVKDFVRGVLQRQLGVQRVGAALILDCIANWDPKQHSQDLPESWAGFMPDFSRRLESNNHTGDFLGVLYRDGVDGFIARRFASYYSRLNNPQYRLELLPVGGLGPSKPSPASLLKHFDVLRSDHSRFWYYSEDNDRDSLNQTIPAILVTDTGPFRGRLRECYHRACDTYKPGDRVEVGLLAKATQAVSWTAADLALGRCGPRGRLNTPQFFTIVSGMLPPDMKPFKRKQTKNDVQNSAFDDKTKDDKRTTRVGQVIEDTSNVITETAVKEVSVSSITNALEMLHFLGVVPSIEEITEERPTSNARAIIHISNPFFR